MLYSFRLRSRRSSHLSYSLPRQPSFRYIYPYIHNLFYTANFKLDYFITRFVKPNFESTLDKALKLLEERCLRPGRGNHHYWVISAAISLVLIQFEPQKTLMLEKQATERVCKLLYRQLSLQDEESEDELVQEVR